MTRRDLRAGFFLNLVLLVAVLLFTPHPCAGDVACGPELLVGGDDLYDDAGPSLAVAPDGTAWVVWVGYDPDEGDEEIFYSTSGPYGWSTAEVLHDPNLYADRFPEISIGSDGVPWVLWYRSQSSGQSLLISHWDGDGWAEPQVVRADPGRWDEYELLAVSSDDIWIMTDTHVTGFEWRLLLTYHWDGTEWLGPWQLMVDGCSSYTGDFAISPDGVPWLCWTTTVPGGADEPVLASWWMGEGWASAETVYVAYDTGPNSQIVFDGPTPMILWDGHRGSYVDILYSRREEGTWAEPALVNLPDSTVYDYDSVCACESGPGGRIVAAWGARYAMDPFSPDIVCSEWTGSGWTPEHAVSDDGPYKADNNPSLGIGPEGIIWVVWVCYEEIAWPWDDDIRGTSCEVTTPVDLGLLTADREADDVRLTWYAAGGCAGGPFFIWRADKAAPEEDQGSPPDDALRLSDSPVTAPPYQWVDTDAPQRGVSYWLEWDPGGQSVFLGPASVDPDHGSNELQARLLFVAPNPSRDGCGVAYELMMPGQVVLAVYTAGGRKVSTVAAEHQTPGTYDTPSTMLRWEGTDASGEEVAAGVYFLRLLHDGRPVESQKRLMTILK